MSIVLVCLIVLGCGKAKDNKKSDAAKKRLAALGKEFSKDGLTRCLIDGNLEAVTAFVEAGMDLDFMVATPDDPDSEKGLAHLAVKSGKPDLVKALARGGVDLETKIKSIDSRWNGLTPLGLAIINNKPDIVDALLAVGADPNGTMKYLMDGNNFTIPPIILAQKKFPNDPMFMGLLLDKGANPDVRANEDLGDKVFFFNPLYLAIRDEKIEQVEVLLSFKADVLSKVATGSEEMQIFDFAKKIGNEKIIDLLKKAQNKPPMIPPIVWVFLAIIAVGVTMFFLFPSLFGRGEKTGNAQEVLSKLCSPNLEEQVVGLQKLFSGFSKVQDPLLIDKIKELSGSEDFGVRFWARKVQGRFISSDPAEAIESKPVAAPRKGPASPPLKQASRQVAPASIVDPFKQLSEAKTGAQCRFFIQQIFDRREKNAFPRLVSYLGGCNDPTVISFLTKYLGVFFPEEDILAVLKPFLMHEDDRVVANTLEGLEAYGKPETFVFFAQMLNHHSHRVQANAAKAIGKFDPTASREMLMKMLEQQDRPHFVIAACKAIGETKDLFFLPAIIHLADNELIGPDALEAISALGGLEILDSLKSKAFTAQDENQRNRVLSAIEYCEGYLSLPILVQLASDESIGPDVIDTISSLGGLKALGILRRRLKSIEDEEQKTRILAGIEACEALLQPSVSGMKKQPEG